MRIIGTCSIVVTTALFASCECLYLFTMKAPRKPEIKIRPTETQPHVEATVGQDINSFNTISNSTFPPHATSDHLRIRKGALLLDPQEEATLTVNIRRINIFNITEEDFKYLDRITEWVSVGQLKNVYKYTKTFELNLDFTKPATKMGIDGDRVIKPNQLNIYTKGCGSTNHRVSPRHGLMGTLILILPTTYTGGEIIFNNLNLEESMEKDRLRFIHLDAGLKYSINEVTSGSRITLMYNVLNLSSLANPRVYVNNLHQAKYYQDLLDEAVEFCRGKKNILLGQAKYPNDVLHKLIKDLRKDFDVIEVAVEKNKPQNITMIAEVYKMKDKDYYSRRSEENIASGEKTHHEFMVHVVEKYKVEHVLFPFSSILKSQGGLPLGRIKLNHWGAPDYYEHWSKEHQHIDYKLECYTAFLINPAEPEKIYIEVDESGSFHETSPPSNEETYE